MTTYEKIVMLAAFSLASAIWLVYLLPLPLIIFFAGMMAGSGVTLGAVRILEEQTDDT